MNLNPNFSVDCVVFGFDSKKLKVLLIERELTGCNFQYALPGDLITDQESLNEAANRVLEELTHLKGIFLRQHKCYGHPDRVKDIKDIEWLQNIREKPQARVITLAYIALVKMNDFKPKASSFAHKVEWLDVEDLPDLAFDHNQIVTEALESLRQDFENRKTGFELLPEKFTFSQIQKLYEIILGRELDKRNFRKKILKEKLLIPTDEKQSGVDHKPALLYKFNKSEVL